MAQQGFNSLNDFLSTSNNLSKQSQDEDTENKADGKSTFLNTNAQKSQAGATQLQNQMNDTTNQQTSDFTKANDKDKVQGGFDTVRWNTPTSNAAVAPNTTGQGAVDSKGHQKAPDLITSKNSNYLSGPASFGVGNTSDAGVAATKAGITDRVNGAQTSNASTVADYLGAINASNTNQITNLTDYTKGQQTGIDTFNNAKNVDQLGTQSKKEGAGASLNQYLAGLNGTTNVGALGNYFGGSYNAGKYGALDSNALGGQINSARGLASSLVASGNQANANKTQALTNSKNAGTTAQNTLNDFLTGEQKTIGTDTQTKEDAINKAGTDANSDLTNYLPGALSGVDSNVAAVNAANTVSNNGAPTVKQNPDGSKTETSSDGTVVNTAKDGSQTVKNADGTTTNVTSDGRASTPGSTGTAANLSGFKLPTSNLGNIGIGVANAGSGIGGGGSANMVAGATPVNGGALGGWNGSISNGIGSSSDPNAGLNDNINRLAAKGLTVSDWLSSGIKSLPEYIAKVGA